MVAAATAAELQFSDRLIDLLSKVECRRAESDAEMDEIFRLRYRAYRDEGAIVADRSRRFSDDFDDMDNAWTFGVRMDERLVGSIRVHVASPEHPRSPAVAVFPDLLVRDLEAGRTIIDPTRFVTDRAAKRVHPELLFITVRLGFAAVQHFSADVALATVRSEHQAFYRRLFGFRPMCMPRDYPTLTKPIVMMENRDRSKLVELPTRYPFLASSPAERQALFEESEVPAPLAFPGKAATAPETGGSERSVVP